MAGLKEWEKPLLPRCRQRIIPAEDVECVQITPMGVKVQFDNDQVKTFRTKDLKFELPQGHVIDVDTLLRQFTVEGYVIV